jgi:hypothetical protein
MRAAWVWGLAVWTVLGWAAVCGAQDEPQPMPEETVKSAPATGMYRIAGTILSAQDGHPLAHAMVRIYAVGRPHP